MRDPSSGSGSHYSLALASIDASLARIEAYLKDQTESLKRLRSDISESPGKTAISSNCEGVAGGDSSAPSQPSGSAPDYPDSETKKLVRYVVREQFDGTFGLRVMEHLFFGMSAGIALGFTLHNLAR